MARTRVGPVPAAALLTVVLVTAGCGLGDGSSSPPPPPTPPTTVAASFEIAPAPSTVAPTSTTPFSVAPARDVLWGVQQRGAARAAPPPAYPLRVSDDGRHLVDANGTPWRVNADSAWLMSTEATAEQVDQYLDTRSQQGFNSFYLMAMVHPGGYSEAPHAPNNLAGDPALAIPGDFRTAGASEASERYWRWIDSIIEKAADRHMVVMLAYAYLGYQGGDMGWWSTINEQEDDQATYEYGKWIGARYKDTPNIIWFGLGDFSPPGDSVGSKRVRAIIDGIKDAGATQPFMAEPSPPDEIPNQVPGFEGAFDMNSFYGYGPEAKGAVYVTADAAWRLSPARPAWMQEGTYEWENNLGHFSGEPWDTRRGRFWSVLAGGTAGDGFGSRDSWRWMYIPDSLKTPAADYSTYAFDFFASMPWWELVPSGVGDGKAGADLVTGGAGTWGEVDYVTSAITKDRTWLLAYVPVMKSGARTITIDMSTLAGPVHARWFDPATGNELAIDGVHPNEGTADFTTPGGRGDGTDDWLLVLSTEEPMCGTVTTAGAYSAPSAIPEGVSCAVVAADVGDPSIVARTAVSVGPSS